jgi:hypothetical protein
MSELSLVLLTLGAKAGDVSPNTIGIAAFAFAFLAVDSTYAMLKNDFILEKTTPWLKRFGFRDLDQIKPEPSDGNGPTKILICAPSLVALVGEGSISGPENGAGGYQTPHSGIPPPS